MKKIKSGTPLEKLLDPTAHFLWACGFSPNGLTLLGLGLTFGVPMNMAEGRWPWAGFWILLAGLFDVLDGALARREKLTSRFGAFFDSTIDRLSEAVVFGGFILFYYREQRLDGCLLAFGVFTLSLLVPYVRARAGGLGLDCKVGILPRPGRVSLLALGFFISRPTWALAAVGFLSLVTVLQRIHWVWVNTKKG